MQGRVKMFLPEKGFGFVRNEGGEWFFHASQVIGSVERGDAVEFWLDDGPKRNGISSVVAIDVRKVEEEQYP